MVTMEDDPYDASETQALEEAYRECTYPKCECKEDCFGKGSEGSSI